jgi:hypothetical protein
LLKKKKGKSSKKTFYVDASDNPFANVIIIFNYPNA